MPGGCRARESAARATIPQSHSVLWDRARSTANAFGAATLTFPASIPDESVAFHAQAFHRTNINPAGFALTNVATSVLGNKGLCNFVFSIDGVNAVSGPNSFNNGAVLLFR